MDIHQYAKTIESVGRFLDVDKGWPLVQPMLEKKMKEQNIIGLKFQMYSGCYYSIKIGDWK